MIIKLKDYLASIKTMVEDKELVSIALNGIFSSWTLCQPMSRQEEKEI
jgi:hypothetical protein